MMTEWFISWALSCSWRILGRHAVKKVDFNVFTHFASFETYGRDSALIVDHFGPFSSFFVPFPPSYLHFRPIFRHSALSIFSFISFLVFSFSFFILFFIIYENPDFQIFGCAPRNFLIFARNRAKIQRHRKFCDFLFFARHA